MENKEDTVARRQLGAKFKEARERAGLTQAEVAAMAKVNANYYAMIERGEGNPSFNKLQRIMKVLKIRSLDLG